MNLLSRVIHPAMATRQPTGAISGDGAPLPGGVPGTIADVVRSRLPIVPASAFSIVLGLSGLGNA
jgi:hypothetical protein